MGNFNSMKSFNLGRDDHPNPAEQSWYFLHVPDHGPWRVTREMDQGTPENSSIEIPLEDIPLHCLESMTLAEAVEQQLEIIGWSENHLCFEPAA